MTAEPVIIMRYGTTTTHPWGLTHLNECGIAKTNVCTCGLLHDLIAMGNPDDIVRLYPGFYAEVTAQEQGLEAARKAATT